MQREDKGLFFKQFSWYLKEEPVFEGENYRVEIKNDYNVSRRLYNGGEYIALAVSYTHLTLPTTPYV